MFAPEIETLPRREIESLQLERLKKIVHYAYNRVDHYRRSFDEAGVSPDDIESLVDLERLPFTSKEVLRQHYPFGMFAVPREDLLRVHASSGTTGKPTVVGYTAADLDLWADVMARALAAAGVRPGDLVHNALGYGLFTGGLGFHDGARRLGCTVIPVSGGLTERQVLLLNDFGSRILFSTPSYALNIAEVAEEMGVNLRAGPLKIGVFGAEPWSDALRAEVEDRLGIKAMDHYGLSEIIGPGVAGECIEAQSGLHVCEDHFLLEVIDPESGETLPYGESGELVITTLSKQALPMIRYRTRDVTTINDEPCVCGRTHARLMRIAGRDDDMLIIRGVNVYPSQVEAALVGFPDIAPHYLLEVRREGTMDSLIVQVEVRPEIGTADDLHLRHVAQEVQHHLKSLLGITCRVAAKRPGEVPRSEGKAVRVRDMRPKVR